MVQILGSPEADDFHQDPSSILMDEYEVREKSGLSSMQYLRLAFQSPAVSRLLAPLCAKGLFHFRIESIRSDRFARQSTLVIEFQTQRTLKSRCSNRGYHRPTLARQKPRQELGHGRSVPMCVLQKGRWPIEFKQIPIGSLGDSVHEPCKFRISKNRFEILRCHDRQLDCIEQCNLCLCHVVSSQKGLRPFKSLE